MSPPSSAATMALHDAIRAHDCDAARAAIREGADLSSGNAAPLARAFENEDAAMVALLLSEGSPTPRAPLPLLARAARRNLPAMVTQLLALGYTAPAYLELSLTIAACHAGGPVIRPIVAAMRACSKDRPSLKLEVAAAAAITAANAPGLAALVAEGASIPSQPEKYLPRGDRNRLDPRAAPVVEGLISLSTLPEPTRAKLLKEVARHPDAAYQALHQRLLVQAQAVSQTATLDMP